MMDLDADSVGVRNLMRNATVFANTNGICCADMSLTPAMRFLHVPFSLFPVPKGHIPEDEFNKVVSLASVYGVLVDRVARDIDFLKSSLSEVCEEDQFTRCLVDRMHSSRKVHFGIHRSDYMYDGIEHRLLQVELNTISSSFGALSTKMSELHRLVMKQHRKCKGTLKESDSLTKIANALFRAHEYYLKKYGSASSVIVFVVQPDETNIADQDLLQQELLLRHDVQCVRMSLEQINEKSRIAESGTLEIHFEDEISEVSVVYFRAGYTPNDYPSEKEWNARECIDKSTAVACPSIAYQLVGTKKMQEVLSHKSGLYRFLGSEDSKAVMSTCTDLYDLRESSDVKNLAITDTNKYLLKPQREGGGNLLFGEKMKNFLIEATDDKLKEFTLMKRISPSTFPAYLIRDGKINEVEAVTELGIFTVFLGDEEGTIFSEPAGHLLRSKASSDEDGGVAAGRAYLDSILF